MAKRVTVRRRFFLGVGCGFALILGVGGAALLWPKTVLNLPGMTHLVGLYNLARPKLLEISYNQDVCMKALAETQSTFTPVDDWTDGEVCSVSGAVRISAIAGAPLSSPATVTCPVALQLATLHQETVQPSAELRFGRRVTRIDHLGTYNCRPMRGFKNLYSEHAFANAIDISGYQLSGGFSINLKSDWGNKGPRGQFLKDVAFGACDRFMKTLSPCSGPAHADHLHLDQGMIGRCN